MGGTMSSDKTSHLTTQPPAINVTQRKNYSPLIFAKGVEALTLQKVFHYQNYKKLQVTYRFLPDAYIHLELTKQKSKQQPGHPLNLGCEMVYGYKFKKNEKTDKIRPDKIQFRRKIYIPIYDPNTVKASNRQKIKNSLKGKSKSKDQESKKRRESRHKSIGKQGEPKKNYMTYKEELIKKLAELKLFSRLNSGVKIGRMIDGSDGILTQHYIQFYSQIAISKGSFAQRETGQKDKMASALQKKGFRVNKQLVQLAYSVFQKGYIIKQTTTNDIQPEQIENRSIKFINREFEDEINKAIVKLDGLTNMMTAIQNHLTQRDVEKAMEKFQENMAAMEQSDRVLYAQQMALILGKYSFYKSYQRQVGSYISSSRSSSVAESRNLSHSRFNHRSMKSDYPEDSTDSYDANGRFSINSQEPSNSPLNMSPRSSNPLRFSESQANNRIFFYYPQQDLQTESPNKNSSNSQSNYQRWQSAQERLKTFILDNDKDGIKQALTCMKNLGILGPLEVEVLYGQLLMQNGKTKHARIIYQRILQSKKGPGYDYLKSEIQAMLGYLSYTKGFAHEALAHYEKALSCKYKIRNYSRKTVLIFNNMAVLCYCLQQYEKCMLYLHRGLRIGQYCSDYQLLMRSNYAMCLAEQGQLKQAKLQMYKTYKNIQPYSNNEIVCKFYSNLGYFDLLDNLNDKAKASFDLACQIQEKFLIPNGGKYSVVLHNNYAIYHYKKSQWRKAALHLEKIQNQINEYNGLKAVQMHFNFGKVYKQLYNYDSAIKHFSQSRYLLAKMEEKYLLKYRQKIQQEIQKIQALRIDEVSQQSSYANKLSRISRSLLSQKHLESKIRG